MNTQGSANDYKPESARATRNDREQINHTSHSKRLITDDAFSINSGRKLTEYIQEDVPKISNFDKPKKSIQTVTSNYMKPTFSRTKTGQQGGSS